jgi:hypothetical protein
VFPCKKAILMEKAILRHLPLTFAGPQRRSNDADPFVPRMMC